MAIVKEYSLADLEHKLVPLWWQERGLQYTASGCGRKIPSARMVRLPGSKRWRRVYVCCYSNAGTSYVTTGPKGRDWIVIH